MKSHHFSVIAAAVTSIFATTAYASHDKLPPDVNASYAAKISKAEKPIKDDRGRTRYIVDLFDVEIYAPQLVKSKQDYIKSKKSSTELAVANLLKDNAEAVDVLGMTSSITPSFFAHLTEQQAEKLAKDKRVKLITEDAYGTTSSVYNNTQVGNETYSWGWHAMNAAAAPAQWTSVNVYVIDSGVELHPDLPLSAANQLNALDASWGWNQGLSPIGCWPHATHVAGIIAASPNGFGVVGIAPNINLISLGFGEQNYQLSTLPPGVVQTASSALAACSGAAGTAANNYATPSISGAAAALDYAWNRTFQQGSTAVANLSFNSRDANAFKSNQTLGSRIKQLALAKYFSIWPGSNYYFPGVFVAQSAGNSYVDACTWAYDDQVNGTDAVDGIMVVGGLNQNLETVQPAGFDGGFQQGPIVPFNPTPSQPVLITPPQSAQPGSNRGACVEVWAPSTSIPSTWTNGSVQLLSGTSMAAPHIAGFAARILQYYPNYTPAQVEAVIRSKMIHLNGDYDYSVNPPRAIRMPRF